MTSSLLGCSPSMLEPAMQGESGELVLCPGRFQAASTPAWAHSTWYAGSLLPPQPSPAPLTQTATNQRNISFHRVLHHREHRGQFPSHSSREFLEHSAISVITGNASMRHGVFAPRHITIWICCCCHMSHS